MATAPSITHKTDIVASGVNLVQSSAKDFSGSCTQKFSQCTYPVAQIINMHQSTKDGICLMLSAKWVGEYLNGGSMWNAMYFGGQFNQAAIISVMHNFIDDEVLGINWEEVRKKYFKQHNVAHLETKTALGSGREAGTRVGRRLGDMILSVGSGKFMTIDVSGPGGAHAVAAWNAGSTYIFFDPNYGEFHFTNPVRYRAWLCLLTRISGYDGMFGRVAADIWGKA
jgi:YopT-type cysteine protease-like protein